MSTNARELIDNLHAHYLRLVHLNGAALNKEAAERLALESTINALANIYQQGYRVQALPARAIKKQLFSSVESHLDVCAALYNYLSDNKARYLVLHPEESETFQTNIRLLKAYTEVARACYVTFHINLVTGGLACASTTSLGFLIGSIVGTFGLTMATTSALLLAATGIGAPAGLLVGIGLVLLINYLRASQEAELKVIQQKIDGSKQVEPSMVSTDDEASDDLSDDDQIPLLIHANPKQKSPSNTAPHAFIFSFTPNLSQLSGLHQKEVAKLSESEMTAAPIKVVT